MYIKACICHDFRSPEKALSSQHAPFSINPPLSYRVHSGHQVESRTLAEGALRPEAGGGYCCITYLMDDASLYYAMILQLAVNPAYRVENGPERLAMQQKIGVKIRAPSVRMERAKRRSRYH